MRARGFVLGALGLGLVALGVFGVAALRTRVATPSPVLAEAARKILRSDVQVRLAEALVLRQELDDARKILADLHGPEARRARARLAIFEADCERAHRELDVEGVRFLEGVPAMLAFAERCARATVGSVVYEEPALGVWLRIQDDADLALAPLLAKAFGSSLPKIEAELGGRLPRPLRIDVVRDLFSLSAVSGLPLEAAETTGTVAIAKFGRVTFLSPRAIAGGFPWEDTVAHEITHLVISKASYDRAPLWLQEGVAKREETRYRAPRPFDRTPDPGRVAWLAQLAGTSVGLDRLGPSIAMLSSGDQARTAFAEVASFLDFWIERNGPLALRALFLELRTAPDDDAALRGVSGLSLAEWQVLYRRWLEERFADAGEDEGYQPYLEALDRYRAARALELLTLGGHPGGALGLGAPLLGDLGRDAEFRFLVARAAIDAGRKDARTFVGDLAQVDAPHAGHLALLSRRDELPPFEAEPFDPAALRGGSGALPPAPELAAHARGLDPLLLEVACLGSAEISDDALCGQVRALPRRGSE